MIDTIRFSIPLADYMVDVIKSRATETMKFDHKTKQLKFRVFNAMVNLGSYDRNVNIFLSEVKQNVCFIELSVPKFYYGHNVYLLHLDRFHSVIDSLYSALLEYFSDFPSPQFWRVERLDVCYSWKFQEEATAMLVLDAVKKISFPRKKKYQYPTSVMEIGRTYSIKWYLKHPEYYTHDFKNLLKTDVDLAHKMEQTSRGVLRFEVTLRKQALQYHFQNDIIRLKDFNQENILALLQFFYNKYFSGLNPKFMKYQDVFTTLTTYYGFSKAKSLFAYYSAQMNPDPEVFLVYKKMYSAPSLRRIRSQLKSAGVGMVDLDDTVPGADFSIPSDFVVNAYTPPPEGGKGRQAFADV